MQAAAAELTRTEHKRAVYGMKQGGSVQLRTYPRYFKLRRCRQF